MTPLYTVWIRRGGKKAERYAASYSRVIAAIWAREAARDGGKVEVQVATPQEVA